MAKKSWTGWGSDNASRGVGGGNSETDSKERNPYWGGKALPDEKKTYTDFTEGAPHLRSDAKLESYVKEVQGDYNADYDEHWGPLYHVEEGQEFAEGDMKEKATKKYAGD
jgi:hypothetical protein